MRYLVLLLFTFAFLGCTKTQTCDIGKTASSLVSAQIAATLECKNIDAVKAEIEKKLVDLKICEAKPAASVQTLAVGDLICKPIIDGLTAGLIGQIPKDWECTGGQVTEDLKAKLIAACTKAL